MSAFSDMPSGPQEDAFARLSAAIAAQTDRAGIMRQVVEATARLLGAPYAALWTLDRGGACLLAAAEYVDPTLGVLPPQPPIQLVQSHASRVLREAHCLVIPDVRHDPRWTNTTWPGLEQLGAYVGVPSTKDGVLLGVLVAMDRPGRVFCAAEIERLRALGTHAVLAIEKAELLAEARAAAARAQVLVEVGKLLTETVDLETVLTRVVEKAAELLQAPATGVCLMEANGGCLVYRIPQAHGLPPAYRASHALRPGECVVGKALREKRPVWTTDVLTDPEIWLSEETRQRVRAHAIPRAILAAPMGRGEALLGALVVYRPAGSAYQTTEIEVLAGLASQAAIAIANARLYEDGERRAREATALAQVGRSLSASLELDRVLELIVKEVQRVTGVPFAGIMTLDEERQELTYAQAAGLIPAHLTELRLKVGEGIAGLAVALGTPVKSVGVLRDPRYVAPHLAEAQGFRSLLCAPLMARGRPLGVLAVFYREERDLAPAEVQLLTQFADQAALALENARLYAATRRAYEDLRAAQDQLVQVEKFRALGAMAGGVAHDFNNLLAAILGRAQMLKMKITDPGPRRDVEILDKVAQDGAQLVRRILDFARVRPEAHTVPVDLAKLAPHVLELTRPRWKDEAQGRGAPIEASLMLEPVAAVLGDPAELSEALVNLVFNAVDAMPKGGHLTLGARPVQGAQAAGPRLRDRDSLSGAAYETADFIEVFVQDTGVGMSEEVRRRAFEPFFTTKGAGGSGLGLAMVYGIVSRHGGEVRLESCEGAGTTVRIRLPAAAHIPEKQESDVQMPVSRHGRIMVVDDDSRVNDVLAELLRSKGHHVRAFTDPLQALADLADAPADLLFTDLGMPEMLGWDVARRARDLLPDLPVILVTGWGDQLDLAQVPAHQVTAVLRKPFLSEDALRLVAEFLPARDGPESEGS